MDDSERPVTELLTKLINVQLETQKKLHVSLLNITDILTMMAVNTSPDKITTSKAIEELKRVNISVVYGTH